MPEPRDTIFALSSGRPPAAIAIVRVCGPKAGLALQELIGHVPVPRRATLARVRHPANGELIDEGLALWFPSPHSETGEDMAELQLHGGHAVISAVLDALGSVADCRPADPGEFSRRAFQNGRLDLTAVEGLADLIAAETPAQRRQALRQLQGLIGDRAEAWRRRLIEAVALVEVGIDFADEADVPEDLLRPALHLVQELRNEISAVLADSGRGERLREGLVVAIAGPPNAGKSTLFNRLVRREAAIVSPFPGTTRDVIEVHLSIEGYPVTLLDTAGMRGSDDPIEQEGIRRARARAEAADLVLWVNDVSAAEAAAAEGASHQFDTSVWVVRNKIDLATSCSSRRRAQSGAEKIFSMSATIGTGVEELAAALKDYAGQFFAASEPALITRARHRRALEDTLLALDRALVQGGNGSEELIAEELRSGATTLGRLTGRVDVEDILEVIFRNFCIGK